MVSRLGGLAYYDTDLDITWLADANAGAGSAFDDGVSTTDGRMTWSNANAWAASLNINGVTGWRLPTIGPINDTTFNTSIAFDGSIDRGYNISAPGSAHPGSTASEMAHLFYSTLGNVGAFDTVGNLTGCGFCFTNTGPFSSILSSHYWSSTGLESNPFAAWGFDFGTGNQFAVPNSNNFSAWAVRSGDVAVVPVPAAVWLFGSGLIGLLGFKHRKP